MTSRAPEARPRILLPALRPHYRVFPLQKRPGTLDDGRGPLLGEDTGPPPRDHSELKDEQATGAVTSSVGWTGDQSPRQSAAARPRGGGFQVGVDRNPHGRCAPPFAMLASQVSLGYRCLSGSARRLRQRPSASRRRTPPEEPSRHLSKSDAQRVLLHQTKKKPRRGAPGFPIFQARRSAQSSRSAGTFPPFSESFLMTALWSQTFIVAESLVSPV
jgi:hypothetical protein